jgi:hypothetical protein
VIWHRALSTKACDASAARQRGARAGAVRFRAGAYPWEARP